VRAAAQEVGKIGSVTSPFSAASIQRGNRMPGGSKDCDRAWPAQAMRAMRRVADAVLGTAMLSSWNYSAGVMLLRLFRLD
jgi:hypothetical protein